MGRGRKCRRCVYHLWMLPLGRWIANGEFDQLSEKRALVIRLLANKRSKIETETFSTEKTVGRILANGTF